MCASEAGAHHYQTIRRFNVFLLRFSLLHVQLKHWVAFPKRRVGRSLDWNSASFMRLITGTRLSLIIRSAYVIRRQEEAGSRLRNIDYFVSRPSLSVALPLAGYFLRLPCVAATHKALSPLGDACVGVRRYRIHRRSIIYGFLISLLRFSTFFGPPLSPRYFTSSVDGCFGCGANGQRLHRRIIN